MGSCRGLPLGLCFRSPVLVGCACGRKGGRGLTFAPRVIVFFNVTSNGHRQIVPVLLCVGEGRLPELPGKQCVFGPEAHHQCAAFSFSNTDCIGALKMAFCS